MFKIAVSFSGGGSQKQKGDCYSLCGKAIAFIIHIIFILLPRIFCWIRQTSWLVVSDILDAKILEYLEQGLAYMRESYCSVVWIALLNQDVAIEAAHLVDGEDTDTTE